MNPAASLQIQITLTGRPCWRAGGTEGALARIDAAWLCLLLLDGEQPRDRVAAWLWPDVTLANARLALRQRLFQLRRRVGHPLLEAAATLRLAPGVSSNLDAQQADLDGGELLGGHDFGDLGDFDRWLAGQRDELERRRADTLSGHAARLEAQGALAEAIACCERIVARRPAFEHAWRRLMRLHYLRGDRAAAIDSFERFERGVCRELGLRPAPETLVLLDTLEQSAAPPQDAPALLPAALLRPPKRVGRAQSWARMAQAWAAGRAVLLQGEGGIGKSRLLEDFIAAHEGGLVHRARPGDAGMPYATVSGLLGRLNERFAPEIAASVRNELARLAADFGSAPAAPANTLLLWRAVESLLAACVNQGLSALGLDDLHQADAASLELLQWLLSDERSKTLRWALASRPGEGEAAEIRRWLGDSQRIVPVPLDRLTLADVQALVESLRQALQLQGDAAHGQALAGSLYRHAGGHAFFTLETLKDWLLLGRPDQTAWPAPLAAQALIARRLARSSESARALAQWVALVPAGLHPDIAARVTGLALPALARAYAELQAAQLVEGRQLAHELVRETLLAELPGAAQQLLHLTLARALADSGQAPTMQMAEHWLAAQAWPEAARALREAAQQSRLAGRLEETEALLQRAAAAADQGGDDAARFDALCHALSARMFRQGAAAVLSQLEALQSQAPGPLQRTRLNALRCEALLNLGQVPDALAAGSAALAEARPGTRAQFEAVVLHGRALALSGRAAEAVTALQSACDSADRQPDQADPQRALQARAALAHALFADNRLTLALQAQTQAVEAATRMADVTEQAHLNANLGVIAAHAGETLLAFGAAERAHRAFATMGLRSTHGHTNAVNLARMAAHRGRFDLALHTLQAVLADDPAHNGPSVRALALAAHAALRLTLADAGPLAAAERALQALSLDELLPQVQAMVVLVGLRLAVHSQQPTQALQERLLKLGQTAPALRDVPMLYREWAGWELDRSQALQHLLMLERRSRDSGALGAARSLLLAALPLARQAEPALAGRWARRLRRELHKGLLAGVYLPEAWLTLAETLQASGDDAAAGSCLRAARRWIAAATLPGALPGAWPSARQAFEQRHPVNRVLLQPGTAAVCGLAGGAATALTVS